MRLGLSGLLVDLYYGVFAYLINSDQPSRGTVVTWPLSICLDKLRGSLNTKNSGLLAPNRTESCLFSPFLKKRGATHISDSVRFHFFSS